MSYFKNTYYFDLFLHSLPLPGSWMMPNDHLVWTADEDGTFVFDQYFNHPVKTFYYLSLKSKNKVD